MSFSHILFYLFAIALGGMIVFGIIRSGYSDNIMQAVYSYASGKIGGNALPGSRDDVEQLATDAVENTVRNTVLDSLGVSDDGFSFDVIADIEPEYSTYEKLLGQIREDGSRMLIVNGDITDKGTREQFLEYQTFTDERLDIPYYTVPGNHDILQDGDTSTFASVFGKRYESFDYNNSHFVLLDNASAARGFDDEQLAWLASDLESTKADHVFLFMHRPLNVPFASAVLGKNNELKEGNIQLFLDTIKDHDIDMIFGAHVPGYLQYTLESVDVPVYASGGGGTPPSIGFLESDFHYLHVNVRGDDVSVKKVELE